MINTPQSDIPTIGYAPTHILLVGTYVEHRGTTYIVGSTTTHQSISGQFTTYASLHAVDADGDTLDVPAIEVNLDIYDPKVL